MRLKCRSALELQELEAEEDVEDLHLNPDPEPDRGAKPKHVVVLDGLECNADFVLK